jgi:hypothetical protein
VSDFTPAVHAAIVNKMAIELGVPPAAITLTLSSASVLLSFSIALESAQVAEAATATLTTQLADTTSASTFFSTPSLVVNVLEVRDAPMSTLPAPSPPPLEPPNTPEDEGGSPSVVVLAAAAGGFFAATLFVCAGMLYLRQRRRPNTHSRVCVPRHQANGPQTKGARQMPGNLSNSKQGAMMTMSL